MVFQKKGSTAVKNVQPKKKGKKQVEAEDDDLDMFKDMDDSDDFEDDSDDDMPVQKTPQNKTPKGKQSLSEKKVTFDMFAKNTPGKTPNKNNSLGAKKTTPAKPLQGFKGIKGGKPQQKRGQVEDDDDEDDDDDDEEDDDKDYDLDIEMGEEDDDDEDGEGEDDDDDEDEDDDDDDEDEDDDDEEEEEEQKPKQKNNVEQMKQKTPIKNENAKNMTPKVKTPKNEAVSPKKEASASPKKNSETHSLEVQRRRERDAKMLFVGGLPGDVTTEELKTLSPDIKNVIIPNSNRKNMKHAFGFICFASEAKAEANFKTLQSKKFRGQLLNIDFVGEKSKKKSSSPSNLSNINERKLYVTGIPIDATIADVAVYFPKAYQISFNKSPSFRSASINFEKIEDANEAFKSNKDIEIKGSKIIVVHSTVTNMNKKKKKFLKNKRNSNAKQGGNPAKKMKFKKEESSDEE